MAYADVAEIVMQAKPDQRAARMGIHQRRLLAEHIRQEQEIAFDRDFHRTAVEPLVDR